MGESEIQKQQRFMKERERIGRELKIKQEAREAQRRAKEEAERAEYRNRIAAQKIAAQTARQISEERQEEMSDNETSGLGTIVYAIGAILQVIGVISILFCVLTSTSNALAVSDMFNFHKGHANLIELLAGGFFLIYGRLLQLRKI